MPTNTFFNLTIEKREKIIAAAKSEFITKSFHNASINKIIKEAGISRGSFYMYFENKEDLFIYILDGYREEILRDIIKSLKGEKCDVFTMAVYLYDYLTGNEYNKEIYEFLSVTLNKVDINLINSFLKLDCSGNKINIARRYTDLSNLMVDNEEELINLLEIVEHIMINELISISTGKYDISIGRKKLLSKYQLMKKGVGKF